MLPKEHSGVGLFFYVFNLFIPHGFIGPEQITDSIKEKPLKLRTLFVLEL
jgi:hypothetical protein